MSVATFEGIVEGGAIRLKDGAQLPEHTKVLVVVPELRVEGRAAIHSPRLRNPADAERFRLKVTELPDDAGV